ncbi:MAG: TolC family protein [Anaerolineae bacterium]|nr:TolC family protein [Gemmatimonadaceae bacterium]
MSEVLPIPACRGRGTVSVRAGFLLLAAAAVFLARSSDAQVTGPPSFGGVTLREVFDSVRSSSPLLGAAKARVRAAQGSISAARTWSNPVVSFESQQMTEQDQAMGPPQRETMTTAMLPLEPIFQRGPRIRRAQALMRASEADVLTQRQQLALDAAGAFYQVALAQVNVTATLSLAQWFDTVVTYNSVRVREGVAAEADLIRSELERDFVLNELAMAESELARAEADLQTFVGGTPRSTVFHVEIDSLPLDSAITVQADRVSRPEVEAARERLVASEAATATERRMFLRELGAMVGTKNSGGSSSLVTGFTLPFPILDQNRGNTTAARAERDVAQFELEQEKRNADAEVFGAERAARILSQRVAAFGSGRVGYLARAEDARRIALGAYREGGTSLLQVIDAARAWREARSSYFETLFAQHLAVIRLLVAEGVDVLDAWPKARTGANQ